MKFHFVSPESSLRVHSLMKSTWPEHVCYSPETLHEYMGKSGVVIILSVDGIDIGYVGVHFYKEFKLIYMLGVLEEHRRKGYATILLKKVVSDNHNTLLQVQEENKGAIAMYENFGFVKNKYMQNYYGEGKHAYEMLRKKS